MVSVSQWVVGLDHRGVDGSLGGELFAEFFAMLTTLAAPIFLGIDTISTMNAFDPIFLDGIYVALNNQSVALNG